MPNHDVADHPLIAVLQNAFAALVEDNVVDIVPQDESGDLDACEVQADAWTLVLEKWPLENAWIAIDDDVTDPKQARMALESTLDRRELEAMMALNAALDGALVTALSESGDILSGTLATMIPAGT